MVSHRPRHQYSMFLMVLLEVQKSSEYGGNNNVGINTTSPSSTFHVVGSATIESSESCVSFKRYRWR